MIWEGEVEGGCGQHIELSNISNKIKSRLCQVIQPFSPFLSTPTGNDPTMKDFLLNGRSLSNLIFLYSSIIFQSPVTETWRKRTKKVQNELQICRTWLRGTRPPSFAHFYSDTPGFASRLKCIFSVVLAR